MNLVIQFILKCNYVCFYSIPLASSVIGVDPFKYYYPYNSSDPYNVTVTCIIHPDSTADQCEVRAMADGRATKIGKW